MIRIAIVEDNESDVEIIRSYVERYEQESETKIQIRVFNDGEDIVEDYSEAYDIILMDVEMGCIDGMTAAVEIRKIDSHVIIIFITNMPQYALEGYKVEALDYVLKPISYFAFSQRIDRALGRLKRRTPVFLPIVTRGGVRKLDVSKILYVEVINHDVTFHTLDGMFTTRESLKEITLALGTRAFFRCHKWCVVNLEYVDSVQNSDISVRGNIIRVSRARRKEFLDALNDYINEVSK